MSSSRPIRVLFAIPALDHGGPDRVLFELLRSIDRARFTPSLLVSEPGGYYLARLPADIEVGVLGGGTRLGRRYPLARALRFVRAAAPDVVFATLRMALTLGLVAPAFPRHTRLILRQATHASTDFAALIAKARLKHRLSRWLAVTTLRRADAVICQSEAMRADLRALLGRDARLHVIGNPIDVPAVTRAASASTATPMGRPALVSVGRLVHLKGYDLLLQAIARLRGRHPDLHLTIFGDGPERAPLTAIAARLGVAAHVTFVGFRAEPLPAVRAADLFVLTSRYEGFPNAALEALACGTPVVLTDCPGANAQLIVPGRNGRLASAISADAIAAALEAAIAELPRYDRAWITADCDARFAAARIAKSYEDVFASVVTRTHAGAAP